MGFTLVNGKWVNTSQPSAPAQTSVTPPSNVVRGGGAGGRMATISGGNFPQNTATIIKNDDDVKKYYQNISADANVFYEKTGEQPNAAWWSVMMGPVTTYENAKTLKNQQNFELQSKKDDRKYEAEVRAEQRKLNAAAAGSAAKRAAQDRLDALAKEKRDRKFTIESDIRRNQFDIDAENRANALTEIARIRGIAGAEEAAKALEANIGTRNIEGLQRIKELYDPMQERSLADFANQVSLLSQNFATARGNVAGAGEEFLKSFVDSIAYKDVPISTFNAPTNPLLAALKSQGASTGEVDAASALAQTTSQSTSDLSKWAAGQLNVGQQNFDIATKRAASGATAAGLQGLAMREPEIKAGMQSDLNKRLDTIAMQRAQAEDTLAQRTQDQQDKAAALRAEALLKYGKDPAKTPDDTAAKAEEERKRREAEAAARKQGIEEAVAQRRNYF